MAMNSFEINKIENTETAKWVKHHLILTVLAIVLGILTIKGVLGAIASGNPFSIKQIVLSAVSHQVNTDSKGHTNILLIGVGGEGHDGSNLTDTMILTSIDKKNDKISMLSIPRDLYVKNEEVGWGSRINGIYQYMLDKEVSEDEAMRVLIEEVQELFDTEIQYFAKVDFKGFTEVVDALGGVEINLEENFSDPYYPAPDGSGIDYQALYIRAGLQTLDGETALKYARSRKTTSDFDRAKRQQEIIVAMKDKALRIGFLLNPSKIKNLYAAISNNFETNLNIGEMLYLAKLAESMTDDSIVHEVISDEAYKPGGFVYTPDRNLYGGAFVLAPIAGDFSELREFASLLLYHPSIFTNKTPIAVLNGTSTEGLATDVKLYLSRYGFNVIEHGNAESKTATETQIFPIKQMNDEDEETVTFLNRLVPGEYVEEAPSEYAPENYSSNAGLVIVLGSDFLDFYEQNALKFYDAFYYQ